MGYDFQHLKHGVGQNSFHLVWNTKYRIPFLEHSWNKQICEGILKLIALQRGFKIHELKVMREHVHMFVELPPYVSVSKAFQLFKGISSRVLRRKSRFLREYFDKGSIWSKGEFFRSVGSVTSKSIEHYIRKSNNWDNFLENQGAK